MNKLVPLGIFLGFALFIVSYNEASAVCCFPYEMTHYIDPETGNLIVNGELWNDSYKAMPFGNSEYEFIFHNSTGGTVFEKEMVVTNKHPLQEGFVIHPGIIPLPFQIVIDDIDSDVLRQVTHVGTGRTSVQYFDWKPPDLTVELQDFSRIATITSKTQDDTFDKWQITGTITNTHSKTTQNIYVVASLYNADHHLVGVAGYSDKDIHPMTLDGHQTKVFQIHALVPQDKSVQSVRLYAESDESSAKYDKTKPIILRPAHVPIKHGVEETPITISANVTNITRDDMDFDWIIQIKKSYKSLTEGDVTKYPNSTVAFVKMVPASVSAQDSQILEYAWVPESAGIYFYEMFLWNNYKPVSLWFRGSFLYSDQILVSTNSLKDQLTKGIPLDQLDCRNNLVLAHKSSNSNLVCVKPDSLLKLVERGWATQSTYSKPDSTSSKSQIVDAVPVGEKYSTGGILRYEKTMPVIDDTYLLHSVKYWQDVPREVLESEYEVQDDFYRELGRLLVKNEMAYQMQRLGIENANDDFNVYVGAVDESLPPHVYYDAVVNGTDGKTYRLQGAAHANRVNYYATEELIFHDTTQQLSIYDILTEPQLVTILPKNGFESSQEPKIAIIHMNNSKVDFFNDSPVTVRIQEHGSGKISDEHELEWIGNTLKPNQRGHITFNATGLYEWDARTPPESDNPDWWGAYGKGTILALSNQTDNLSADKRIKMAGTMIMESELPISALGMGKSDGLRVYFGDAIHEMLPDSVQYYENRIKQMIPFDVNVIIE